MASGSEVFILGGRGLVGSAFARHCQRAGLAHVILDRQNYAAYAGASCEIFVNANGNSRKLLAAREPLAEFDASVRSVRASLTDFRFRTYVHISSCDVYPDCSTPATTRESIAPDPARQSPYGFHKHLAEQCVQHAAADWLIFRCGGFVGPGLKKNAIYDILHRGPLYLDPSSELQFLHTDRAAETVWQLVQAGVRREIFNLCGRGVVQLREVAALAGTTVPVAPGSPLVRYEISLEKIQAHVPLPETRPAVLEFVRQQIQGAVAGT
jgi:nucleoside-diphosphate-sugar epimerase